MSHAHAYKPLDLGNGEVAASVAPDGRLLAVGGFHPRLGYVVLEGAAPFPAERRGDQAAVRAYRAALAAPGAPGLGLVPERPWTEVAAGLLADSVPAADLTGPDGIQARVVTWAPSVAGPGVIQHWRLHNPGPAPLTWRAAFTGPLRLGRAAMTELVEGGPLPDPPSGMRVEAAHGVLVVTAPAAGLAAAVAGLPSDGRLAVRRTGDGRLQVRLPVAMDLAPGATRTLVLAVAIGTDPAAVTSLARRLTVPGPGPVDNPQPPRSGWATLPHQGSRRGMPDDARPGTPDARPGTPDARPGTPDARLLAADARLADELGRRSTRLARVDPLVPAVVRALARRALAYVLDCCALPVGEATCLLTDHRLLPLSWNRDAWFAVEALAAVGDPGAGELAGRHLRWLFQVAERPGGAWGRAYLPNGRVKDPAYQLDQQCWPLLELAGHLDRGGDLGLAAAAGPVVDEVLGAVAARRADGAELFATEETPGDDPVPMPYHFSSHVLLWHTLNRLAAVLGRPGLAEQAARVRADVRSHLVAVHDGRELFAYAADLRGGHALYHDANDLPTALAPRWEFCAPGDPVWRATMAVAFSPANPGFAAGRFGGLGSVHTPGAWPLGDIQELIWARLAGDTRRTARVLGRLAATACQDGALPEARDPADGTVRSRHWFAWPGAALLLALA
jgi:Metal-independent alpha-mannosidase (GH125)